MSSRNHGWKDPNDKSYDPIRRVNKRGHDDEDRDLFKLENEGSTTPFGALNLQCLGKVVYAIQHDDYSLLREEEATRLKERLGCRWFNTYMRQVVKEFEERAEEYQRALTLVQHHGNALRSMDKLTTRLLRVKEFTQLKEGESAMAMSIAWDYEARRKKEERAPLAVPLTGDQEEWVGRAWAKFGDVSSTFRCRSPLVCRPCLKG